MLGKATPLENGQLSEQFRQSSVLDRQEATAGGHAKSIGQIRFAATGRAEYDDVVALPHIVAGAEPCDSVHRSRRRPSPVSKVSR